MKKQNLGITVLFCLFLGVMLLLTLLLPHKTFSEQENRNLEAPPRLTGKDLLSGRFMKTPRIGSRITRFSGTAGSSSRPQPSGSAESGRTTACTWRPRTP